MKNLLAAIAAGVILAVSGCAGYGGTTASNSLMSGTQPAKGVFPSQVVGP